MTALFLALVLQAPGLPIDELTHPAQRVREAAIARVAAGPLATADVAVLFDHADSRLARAAIAVCVGRLAEDALPALARCGEHEDQARAEAAGKAVVTIALHHAIDLEGLDFSGMRALPARIQRAVDADAELHLPRIRGFGHTDKTQNYRRYFAAGRYARKTLERIGRDRHCPERVREHALHALAMLDGYRAEAVLIDLLDDAALRVRITCGSLIYHYGTNAAMRTLARRLEGPRLLQEREASWIVAAVERTRILGDAGMKKLVRYVRLGPVNRALGAAAALRNTRPEIFRRVVRARVERMFRREAKSPRAATDAALFELRVGPLEGDLRARMRKSKNPLVRAAATDDGDEALRVIAPAVAPPRAVGGSEATRVRVVSRLLIRHNAPARDRVRFAKVALDSAVAASRRSAVRVLQGTGDAARTALRPRLLQLLGDRYESVRLGAARLLAPDERAIEVAIQALYDGDYGSARVVRRILQAARPDWPVVNADGHARDRRRQARALRRLHKSVPRGKE